MNDKLKKVLLPLGGIFVFLAAWQLLGEFSVIEVSLFSSPIQVFLKVLRLKDLHLHILNSLFRLFVAVILGSASGFVAGIAISYAKWMELIEDVISFFMAIPGISWAPLFIITIGFGNRTIVAVGAITAFVPVVYNVVHGIREIDRNLLRAGDVLGYSAIKQLFYVKIPAIMHYLIIGIKLSFASAWRTIIAVEMIAATTFGLGYMVFNARELLRVDVMFSGIIISGGVFLVIERALIHLLENKTVVRWGVKSGNEV
jgi:NitT/TauT family transport system permease protein